MEAVTELLNNFLQRFDLTPIFTSADVLHWFIPQPNIIESFVVEDPDTPGKLTDFVSFYTLPSTVMNHPTHNTIKAAYSFYNVSTVTSWPDLMGDALILAKKANFDVFNALDLMENRWENFNTDRHWDVEDDFFSLFQRIFGETEVRDW